MSTITYPVALNRTENDSRQSLFARMIHWSTRQQQNRLLWLGLILTAHTTLLTPLTMSVVLLTGAPFSLLILTLSSITMAVVTNLAALPTRITIPVFALSLLIDAGVLVSCLMHVMAIW